MCGSSSSHCACVCVPCVFGMSGPSAVGIDRPCFPGRRCSMTPSSKQPVIDPAARLRIPRARDSTCPLRRLRVCVCASVLYSFGWAAGRALQLVNLDAAAGTDPKAMAAGKTGGPAGTWTRSVVSLAVLPFHQGFFLLFPPHPCFFRTVGGGGR